MVPFVDLRTQYMALRAEINDAVDALFTSTNFVLGPAVEAFEKEFASYVTTEHAMGVNSGTSALHLALLAAGVRRGDEVITTPFTFIATASAIDYIGATPVFVDVDPVNLTIDPQRIEAAITERTKAILPVHIHGNVADMDPIMEIARRHGLAVVEDAAQAHGAEYKGRRAGSIGDLGCFSFYPGKNLGAYGEGGAVTTDDPDLAAEVRLLRDWGATRRYHHERKGFNYRLEGVQGAILSVKMPHIEAWTEARRTAAARYDRLLGERGIAVPVVPDAHRSVYHVYAIRHRERDALQAALTERGIGSGIHYPIPVHLQGAFSELGHQVGDFPITEAISSETVSLPMFPEITPEQQDEVVDAVCRFVSSAADRSSTTVGRAS